MTNPTTSTIKLTDGQQGVIQMYDTEIAFEQRQINAAQTAFDTGSGGYDEIRYHRDQLEELTKERRETLEWYASK